MRIARTRLTRYAVPFRQPYVTAAGTATSRDGLILEIETDGGVTGLGEGSLLPHLSDVAGYAAALAEAAADLPGTPVEMWTADAHPRIHPLLFAPISLAAWDAIARTQVLPLSRLLNREARDVVDVNALIGGGDAASVESSARRAVEAGYATVKLKVGVANDAESELERIAAARRAIGPAARLRLDANGAWDEDTAIEVLRAAHEYDIEYTEQPVWPGDPMALQRIEHTTRVPIAADEEISTADAATKVIEAHAASFVILKPLQLGGVNDCRRLESAARKQGIGVVFTTSIDSGVGTAAALHLAAAYGSDRAHGLSTLPLIEHPLIVSPDALDGPTMQIGAAPGLGIAIDRDVLARYTQDEWEFTT